MKNSVILFGGIVVSLIFFGVFYFFLDQRSRQIEKNLDQLNPSTITYSEADYLRLPKSQLKKVDQENTFAQTIQRGTVISASEKILSILTFSTPANPEVKIIEVRLNGKESYFCWDEIEIAKVGPEFDIKSAYLTLNSTNSFAFSFQREINNQAFLNQAKNGFVFLNVTSNNNDQLTVKEIAILGCS